MSRTLRLLPLLAFLLLLSPAARAVSDPSEMLPDPQQEARAEAIGRQLRCLVCQNESIEDSGADLARDLRKVVREHVAAGESDRQIIDWMVARYGNFVRLRPPFLWQTLPLWASPGLALIAGALLIAFLFRQRRETPPLTPEERRRLEEIARR